MKTKLLFVSILIILIILISGCEEHPCYITPEECDLEDSNLTYEEGCQDKQLITRHVYLDFYLNDECYCTCLGRETETFSYVDVECCSDRDCYEYGLSNCLEDWTCEKEEESEEPEPISEPVSIPIDEPEEPEPTYVEPEPTVPETVEPETTVPTEYVPTGEPITTGHDGDYLLAIGDTATASNGVSIEVVSLEEWYRNRIGVNFFVGDKKVNSVTKVLTTSLESDEDTYNVFYGLKITYPKDFVTINGTQRAQLNIESYEDVPITSCQDLVNLCLMNGYNSYQCNDYCTNDPADGEVAFRSGNIVLILPDEVSEIGDELLNQIELCYDDGAEFLGVTSPIEELIVRAGLTSSGLTVSSMEGIKIPIIDTGYGIQSFIEKWSDADPNQCSDYTLVHELIHHHLEFMGLQDYYNEGIATFAGYQIVNSEYPVMCYEDGWSREGGEGGNAIQRNCFGGCLNDCYENRNSINLYAGEYFEFDNGKKITITNVVDKEISFRLIDSQGYVIDEETLFVGDLYDYNNFVLLFFYVFDDDKVNLYYFEDDKQNQPTYCQSNCRDMCDVRLGNNKLSYMEFSDYLTSDYPYKYTTYMFYNTGNCFFEMIENTGHENVVELFQRGDQLRGEEFCLIPELRDILDENSFQEIDDIFNVQDECITDDLMGYIDSNIWDPSNQE